MGGEVETSMQGIEDTLHGGIDPDSTVPYDNTKKVIGGATEAVEEEEPLFSGAMQKLAKAGKDKLEEILTAESGGEIGDDFSKAVTNAIEAEAPRMLPT